MSAANDRRIVTVTDVALAAGVSPSTVSRVLTGSHRVRAAREQRVLDAAARLGYRPNAAARALRRSRTMTLGIVCRWMDSSMVWNILGALAARTQEREYSLLVTNAQGSDRLYVTLIHRLFEARVDGLFLATPLRLGDSLRAYLQAGVPVLGLFSKDESAADLPLVTWDEGPAVYAAVERLLELGHRRFGCVTSPSTPRMNARIRLIDAALRASGVADTSHVIETYDPGEGRSAIRPAAARLLDRPARPTAIFCPEPFVGPILAEVSARGLAVPADLALIVANDSPSAGMMSPAIASISVVGEDIGRVAADVMIDWLQGTAPAPTTYARPAQWREHGALAPPPACAAN